MADLPNLKDGVAASLLEEEKPFLGQVDDEPVVLVRAGGRIFAAGANCTHYGGPLAEGLVVDGTIRCPWHHACFKLENGEAVGAPALSPIACYSIEVSAGTVRVLSRIDLAPPPPPPQSPSSVVVIGAGAAGAACVETLRAKGYAGPITLVGDEAPGPVDRPNLSKDYLAGNAPEEWIPLRTADHYQALRVEFLLGDPAASFAPKEQTVTLRSGREVPYGVLVLATGAAARTLTIPGADLPHVHRLRTLADSRAIIAGAAQAKRAAIVGAGFIGLEAAASLRARGLDVNVVAVEAVPLDRILGPDLGAFVQRLHEEHGVRFHMGQSPKAIHPDRVELSSGQTLPADLVILGVGVTPRTELAENAGLRVHNGIVVDESLRASAPNVYAAGDVARFPDPRSGGLVRIEHWALAERHGQAVARHMLGLGGPFTNVPYFWSAHYDTTISYVGHAPFWDQVDILGDLGARDAAAVYRRGGNIRAVATVNRDLLSLQVEVALERYDTAALEKLLA